jgi:hypothetical protein
MAVAFVVASRLYLWAFPAEGSDIGDGTPSVQLIVAFGIWMVSSVTCLLTVPYAGFALRRDASLRTSARILIVGAGATLLLSFVAYVIAMFVA